jgi:hypothetical protein
VLFAADVSLVVPDELGASAASLSSGHRRATAARAATKLQISHAVGMPVVAAKAAISASRMRRQRPVRQVSLPA